MTDQPKTPELLPCPFCNDPRTEIHKEPLLAMTDEDSDFGHWVECVRCAARGPLTDSLKDPISPWNTRLQVGSVGEVERLKDERDHEHKLAKARLNEIDMLEEENQRLAASLRKIGKVRCDCVFEDPSCPACYSKKILKEVK